MSWCGEVLQQRAKIRNMARIHDTGPGHSPGLPFYGVHHAGSADKHIPSACPSRNHSESPSWVRNALCPWSCLPVANDVLDETGAPVLDFLDGEQETINYARNCHSECSSGHIRARFNGPAAVFASGALDCLGSAAQRYGGIFRAFSLPQLRPQGTG